jgi:hypothetical protein
LNSVAAKRFAATPIFYNLERERTKLLLSQQGIVSTGSISMHNSNDSDFNPAIPSPSIDDTLDSAALKPSDSPVVGTTGRTKSRTVVIREWLELNKVFLELALIPLLTILGVILTVLGVVLATVQIRDARKVSAMQEQQRVTDERRQKEDSDRDEKRKQEEGLRRETELEILRQIAKLQESQGKIAELMASDTRVIASSSRLTRIPNLKVLRRHDGFAILHEPQAEVVGVRMRQFKYYRNPDSNDKVGWWLSSDKVIDISKLKEEGPSLPKEPSLVCLGNFDVNFEQPRESVEVVYPGRSPAELSKILVNLEVQFRVEDRKDRWVCMSFGMSHSKSQTSPYRTDDEILKLDLFKEGRFDQDTDFILNP